MLCLVVRLPLLERIAEGVDVWGCAVVVFAWLDDCGKAGLGDAADVGSSPSCGTSPRPEQCNDLVLNPFLDPLLRCTKLKPPIALAESKASVPLREKMDTLLLVIVSA